MEQSFMIILSCLLTLFYVILIVAYFISWLRIPYFKVSDTAEQLRFSILVPARNEEHSIEKCLGDILAQQYPASHYEVIVINDHSTDNTAGVVQSVIDRYPQHKVRLLQMHDDERAA
jgi:cellulose synthase/poly-beta-1,6-N-acetylglucosamine synthase-like glycosyltransferase